MHYLPFRSYKHSIHVKVPLKKDSLQQNETYLQCVSKRAVGGACGCFKVSPHLCHFPLLTFTNLQSLHSYCWRDGLAAQSLQQTHSFNCACQKIKKIKIKQNVVYSYKVTGIMCMKCSVYFFFLHFLMKSNREYMQTQMRNDTDIPKTTPATELNNKI